MSIFNPWDDIKSKVTFGVAESDVSSFILFLDKNSISRSENYNDDEDSELVRSLQNLKDLDFAISEYFKSVTELDIIYEKHRFRGILSRAHEDINQDSIVRSSEAFSLLNRNIAKISNLLKNAVSTSNNSSIVVPYDLRFCFINAIKYLATALSNSSDLTLLNELQYLNIKNVEKTFECLKELIENIQH